MKAEIISIGTELLLGQICNTNAQYLSQKCAELGISVFFHTAVGDNPDRLNQVISIAQQRSDFIFFTGGLGPTKDDLTKESIATIVGKKLIENKPAMDRIHRYFTQHGIEMTENNRRQAQVIEGCEVFPNDYGMAPGMAFIANDLYYILLPGPPFELNPMFEQYTMPYLRSLLQVDQIVHSKILHLFGIGESTLEEKLIDLIDSQSNPTIALLASDGEVSIRLTAKAEDVMVADQLIATVETKIRSRVGEWLYGYDDETLAGVVSSLLRERNFTIAVAESCSGGALSMQFTGFPGASAVFSGGIVSYTAKAKVKVLGVCSETLEQDGTISKQTASEMASQARELFDAYLGISVTGVAGPAIVEAQTIGTVFIGLATEQEVKTFPLQLSGSREEIQLKATKHALFHIYQWLNNKT